jgi:sugar phosphate isomerase/epimerase
MRKIGIQLYTVRETIKKDGLIPVLKEIAAIGYAGIEGGAFMDNLPGKELRRVLDDLGLAFVSGAITLADIEKGEEGMQPLLDEYVTLGAKYVMLPWVGEEYRKDAADWKRTGQTMERAAIQVNKRDLTFVYHNHDFEFKKFDGVYGLDILFGTVDQALVKSEMDVYWVKKGGADPMTYMRKYAGRTPIIHAKDMTKDGSPHGAQLFETVGDGLLDFDAIFATGDQTGVDWYLVEQDLCPKGELASARRSFENIKWHGWLGA